MTVSGQVSRPPLGSSYCPLTARQAYEDGRAWDTIGEINGCTLADYCRANDLTQPHWSS